MTKLFVGLALMFTLSLLFAGPLKDFLPNQSFWPRFGITFYIIFCIGAGVYVGMAMYGIKP